MHEYEKHLLINSKSLTLSSGQCYGAIYTLLVGAVNKDSIVDALNKDSQVPLFVILLTRTDYLEC